MTGGLLRRRETERHGHGTREVAISRRRQGLLTTPKLTSKTGNPSVPDANIMISDFLPPEPETIRFCCFKPPNVWHFVTAAPKS
jgi:hypothetical protein